LYTFVTVETKYNNAQGNGRLDYNDYTDLV